MITEVRILKLRLEQKVKWGAEQVVTLVWVKRASLSAGSYYPKTKCKFSWFQKVEYHHLLSFSNDMFSLKVNIALYSETAECKGESGS